MPLAGARSRDGLRALVLGVLVVAVEWLRALAARQPDLLLPSLAIGGAALCAFAVGWRPAELGLSRGRLGLRLLGGLALAAALLLPAAVRAGSPLIPVQLAAFAVVVSVGEEVAFRGALFAALERWGGGAVAVLGSTAAFALAHVLSHPPEFLWAVAAAGLLLGLWRWACRDLVAPIVGHVLADLAL